MTKWSRVFHAMTLEQWKKGSKALGLNLICIVLTFVISLFSNGTVSFKMNHVQFQSKEWLVPLMMISVFWCFVFGIYFIIQALMISGRQIQTNRYRLIPLADWKLYLAQISSVIVNWLYVAVVYGVYFLGMMLAIFLHENVNINTWLGSHYLSGLLLIFVGLFVAVLLFLVLCHLIGFLSDILVDHLPGQMPILIQILVDIVLFVVMYKVLQYLFRFIQANLLHIHFLGNSLAPVNGVWGIVVLILLTVIIFIVNAFLVEHLETNR
ncbi:hypothetical protein MOO45_00795 [Bombilactobacillus folatiphilus]|uniref:ABC transporter permease n=1 Tax=Bombilactobacillus folatiphilus TaxID=2923362 RepID=A0ABY4P9Q2_9LACO|nr:hypothetical protein [Bombilactobacillus folatiphilus]UQS82261.1 hypothetical protein MOO45_00795 [Bombilactobacillus folatiphilus]